MKHIISTVVVFGLIVLLIVAGAYLFQSLHGVDSIKNIDNKIVRDIGHALEGDNVSDNLSENDNGSVERDAGGNEVEKSIGEFFDADNIKENIKNGIGKMSGLLDSQGISLDKIKENENVKSFLDSVKGSDNVSIGNEPMEKILHNETVQKIFSAEGLALDSESVEAILSNPAVKEFFKTGKSAGLDNSTLKELLNNPSIREFMEDNASIEK